jgi:hypothetical protein
MPLPPPAASKMPVSNPAFPYEDREAGGIRNVDKILAKNTCVPGKSQPLLAMRDMAQFSTAL